MSKIVPPFGSLNATLVFVGEAPGAQEEIEGRPFVGASGQLLNSVLAQVGIDRHSAYLTNVVKTRPPSNNFEVFYADGPKKTLPSPMLSASISELHAELGRLRPSVIVPLGGEALRAITNKRSIDSWRGSILPFTLRHPGTHERWECKVIPTYHPARILREYTRLPIFEHDLQRVKKELSLGPTPRVLPHRLELNPSYERVVEFLTSLLEAPRAISFDIETSGNHVRCLGIADSPTHALCIPFMSFSRRPDVTSTIYLGPTGSPEPNSHWTEEEELSILCLLSEVFSSRSIAKYAQNFPFDSQILAREFGFTIHGLSMDTMVGAHTMYCELPKGLDFLASLYTDVPYYSDYDASSDEELWRYNCFDCCVTYEIACILRDDLQKRSTSSGGYSTSLDFFSNHIQPAMQVMTIVSQRGVRCDLKVRDELKSRYESEMVPLLAEFHHLAGSLVNPSSPKQMAEFLYDKLSLPKQYNNKTKALTADDDAIEALTKKAPHHARMFHVLSEWKTRQKLVSTYLNIPLTHDNRLITTFNVVGTKWGRCNSSRDIWGFGTNLQNIPIRTDLGRELRRMFIADDGCVLVKTDLSQAEFRLVCWFAKIERLIQKYIENPSFDIHKWVASLIFKVLESEVVKSQRDIAKNGVYGGNYAMMAPTAALTYKIPLAQASWVLSEYRKAIPEVPQWWLEVQRNLNATRTIVSPLGRVVVFMDRMCESVYRDAYSCTCQNVVADLIHRASILSHLCLGERCYPVLQIHDELVFQCPVVNLNWALLRIKRIMEYPLSIPPIATPLTIPADVSYGHNWLEQVKWDGRSEVDITTLTRKES